MGCCGSKPPSTHQADEGGRQRFVNTVEFFPDDILELINEYTEDVFDGGFTKLIGHTSLVTTIEAVGDGLMASGSKDATVRLWDIVRGDCLRVLENHRGTGTIKALAWLGGRHLASASDRLLCVWDLQNGNCLRSLPSNKSMFSLAKVGSSDNDLLAVGVDDGLIYLSHFLTGEHIRTLQGHEQPVSGLAACATTHMASASRDLSIRVWDVQTGECQRRFSPAHEHWITSLVFLRGWRLASGSDDGSVRIWDIAEERLLRRLTDLGSGSVYSLAALQDGRVACACFNRDVLLWEPNTAELVQKLQGHDKFVTSVCVCPSRGWIASASGDGYVRIFKAQKLNLRKMMNDALSNICLDVDDMT